MGHANCRRRSACPALRREAKGKADSQRKQLPALTAVYNGALQKEADEQAMKKQPQKETLSRENETTSTTGRS
jgi:hypothetical protein